MERVKKLGKGGAKRPAMRFEQVVSSMAMKLGERDNAVITRVG